jgi:hypothetical protein
MTRSTWSIGKQNFKDETDKKNISRSNFLSSSGLKLNHLSYLV